MLTCIVIIPRVQVPMSVIDAFSTVIFVPIINEYGSTRVSFQILAWSQFNQVFYHCFIMNQLNSAVYFDIMQINLLLMPRLQICNDC